MIRRSARAPALVIFSLAFFSAFGAAADPWQTEVVDGATCCGYSYVAIDPSGSPHVAYSHQPEIRHAWKSAGGWSIETIGLAKEPQCPIAIGADNVLHVLFQGEDQRLKYASKLSGGSWNIETVDDSSVVDGSKTLTIDAAGNPHVVYQKQYRTLGYEYKRYATKSGGGWQVEPLLGTSSFGQAVPGSSLALDASGHAHVAFAANYSSQDNLLVYGREVGGVWTYETVSPAVYMQRPVVVNALILDAGGNPHIEYKTSGSPQNLCYAFKDGGGWHQETITERARSGPTVGTLVLDSQGTPHVAYCDVDNSFSPILAVRRGGVWQTEFVNLRGGAEVNDVPSLAVAPSGILHMSYEVKSSWPGYLGLIHAVRGPTPVTGATWTDIKRSYR